MSIKRALATAVAAVGWLIGGPVVAAPAPDPITSPSYLYSFVGIHNGYPFDANFVFDAEDFNTVGTTSVAGQVPSTGSPFASGQANASYGTLGAAAQAFGQAPASTTSGVTGGYFASAGSMFTDGFTIVGGSGTALTSTTLSGAVGAAPDAIMAYLLLKSTTPFLDLESLEIAAGQLLLTGMLPPGLDIVATTLGTPSIPFTPVLTGSYTYTSGVPVYLASFLVTFAERSGAANFLTTAQFGITAPPGGTLSTLSQVTYAQAVPEPATWALVLAGLALLGVVSARRAKR